MVPYLKGIHLTLDGWRKFRDDEGWKLPAKVVGQMKVRSRVEDALKKYRKRLQNELPECVVFVETSGP
eukprot:scaffold25703_cov171-Cylindrotheca_fusiformis.AAC.1